MGCSPSKPEAAETVQVPVEEVETEPQAPPSSPAVKLGVVRLDYNYPPALGDVDNPESFKYPVVYRCVPGLTFKMCQSGELTDEVKGELCKAVRFLIQEGVHCITGDCGFMMYLQKAIRTHTHKSHVVCMSSLAQLPAVTCAYGSDEQIAIFTANSETLTPMKPLIREECGVDPDDKRFVIVGCQDVDGFDAVALGQKVNVEKVTPGMVAKARETIEKYPQVRAFLFECTELPPYADAVRAATGMPVYDSITCCNTFMMGFQDSGMSGMKGWQEKFNGEHHKYILGENLTEKERENVVSLQNAS